MNRFQLKHGSFVETSFQICRNVLHCICMAYLKRGSAPTNTIKLTLDFDTLDRLKAHAAARKVDTTRCAYELIQEALGLREAPPATEPAAIELDAPAFDWNRVAAFNKPRDGR